MPFRQPDSSIIDADRVRVGAYSFRVEASLASEQSEGKLVIDASAGYLLTSSDGKAPRQHLNLDYVVQPDGSRVAHDTLMLLRGNESVTDGTVTLRDPVGETLVLRVVPGGAANHAQEQPELIIDRPVVRIDKTNVGEESFAILNIGQRHAHTPISVVVDDPTHFSIATGGKQLLFGPSLYFTPALAGTYIHVRYQPGRPGRHTATLYIETPYQIKKVGLTGRTTGLIAPTLGRSATGDEPDATRPMLPAPAESARSRVNWPLPALLLGGLALAGYAYRCEWAPSLCRQSVVEEALPPTNPVSADRRPAFKPPVAAEPEASVTDRSERRSVRSRPEASQRSASEAVAGAEANQAAEDRQPRSRRPVEPGRPSETEPTLLTRPRSRSEAEPARPDATRRTPSPAESPEESELERELNKKPGGNP